MYGSSGGGEEAPRFLKPPSSPESVESLRPLQPDVSDARLETITGLAGVACSLTGATISQKVGDSLIEIPECSIVASDAANEAVVRFTDGQKPERKRFLMADEHFGEEAARVKWLSSNLLTQGGFFVRYGLAVDTPSRRIPSRRGNVDPTNLTLVAVTRDNVAFPIVKFNRSTEADSYCDFLQFWGEESMSELESTNFYGWGSDDNGPRFEAVQTVRRVIAGDGRAIEQMTRQLKIDKILASKLGEPDAETEALLTTIFEQKLPRKGQTFERIFNDVQIGRALTNIRVLGKLSQIEGDRDDEVTDTRDRRKLVMSRFPVTQANRSRQEDVFIFDKRDGVTLLSEGQDKTTPSQNDIEITIALLGTSSHAHVWNRSQPKGGRSINTLSGERLEKTNTRVFDGLATERLSYLFGSTILGGSVVTSYMDYPAVSPLIMSSSVTALAALGMILEQRAKSSQRKLQRKKLLEIDHTSARTNLHDTEGDWD